MNKAAIEPVIRSIGYNPAGKLVVRAFVPRSEEIPREHAGAEIEIPTDHVCFARMAALGVRVFNSSEYREK